MSIEKLRENITWECKQCHRPVSDKETVAYHLLNGMLYGWCEECFAQRRSFPSTPSA